MINDQFLDGAERRQDLERELAEARGSVARLSAALEATVDGLLVVDAEGSIQSFNEKFVELWGIPSSIVDSKSDDHALGYVVDQMVDPEAVIGKVRELYDSPMEESTDLIKLRDGRDIERHSRPQLIDGAPVGRVWTFRDVTSRNRADEELRWKSLFVEAQVNSSIDGILVVDSDGKKILQNEQMNKLWGIPQHVSDNDDDNAQVQYVLSLVKHPEAFGEKIKYLYANPDVIERTEFELKDGTVLDRFSSPVISTDGKNYGRIWNFRDVTERKRNEEALRESEEGLRTLTESMPQLVWICQPDGQNQYLNRRWVDYTGQSVEDGAGRGWGEPLHPEDRPRASLIWRQAAEVGDAYEIECRLRRADGAYRWFLQRGLPLRDSTGQIVKWFGTFTDIHDLKGAEEALLLAQNELEERVAQRTVALTLAIDEAERANRAKSEFLSRMSHELRTPLNAILGFGQILQLSELKSSDVECVSHILSGGRHLLSLINEILDIARVEAGRSDLSIESVSLGDIVNDSYAMVLPLANQREIRVNLDVRDFHAMADSRRLKQVMINLLSNAIKYNREGGTVFVTCSQPTEGKLRIAIRDTGAGLDRDDLRKLFTPFERLAAANSDVEGTGLGLVLSQRLITAMGGVLEAESVVGEGSTFTIELPEAIAPAEAFLLAQSEEPGPESSGVVERPLSVLCIEDNLANLRLIEVIFASRPDVSLLAAMQGSMGVDLAREHLPDVILLDVNLPDMSGKEVMSRLKQCAVTKDIPVIVISADATTKQMKELLDAGVKKYLTKPLDIAEFLSTLDQALQPKVA